MLCGPSGCGKTTLLKQLKPGLAPHGEKTGSIYLENTPLAGLTPRNAAAKIGFVMQSPENQIVTDKVWHELAFGLENLGLGTPEIRLRVAEMASFFGIQTWFHKPVTELSGGQKQILTLASCLVLQPSVLILDEPTSQLDPIAAEEFLATLGKINRELGITVILTEHRLEAAFPLATRAVVLDKGKIAADGLPKEVGLHLRNSGSGMLLAMPTPMRIWMAVNNGKHTADIPITARDGAQWLNTQTCNINNFENEKPACPQDPKTAVSLSDVWFRYDKNLPDIVKGLSFKAYYGEISAILGGNGTGKTTTLSLIAGLHSPYRGKVYVDAVTFALPQNPQTLFVAKTVLEDLLEVLSGQVLSKPERSEKLAFIEKLCRLEGLLDKHPYDLSGGEQQRAALAKVLLLEPKILLLDEPTKGLDAEYKQTFAAILHKLAMEGTAIIIISHDLEFCAEHADKCSLFFDGNIATQNTPRTFFSGNSFYTTTANRMARHLLPNAITPGDVMLALGVKTQLIQIPIPNLKSESAKDKTPCLNFPERAKKSMLSSLLPRPREWLFLAFTLLFISSVLYAWANWGSFAAFLGGGREAIAIAQGSTARYIALMLALAAGISGIIISLTQKRGTPVIVASKKLPLSRRTLAAAILVLLSIPLTLYVGVTIFDDRRFYFISVLIILQTMLPFVLVFESRKPQAREIITIAVLCAIAVAGRSAFFMLPQFKPVIAIVIISGVAFGGEAGFLVGSMTGFLSNIFFGQGPWTPWQMFAFGIIGFLAGILFCKGMLGRSPLQLAVFGGLSTFIIYGGIMNPASVIMWQPNPTPEMFILAYLQGIPFDLVHSAATVFFLTTISRPLLEKLDRIKIKYGLVE